MIITLKSAINILCNILGYAIFIEVILSWVYRGRGNVFIDILHIFTDPFMIPARKIHEKLIPSMMLDFSPIIAYFLIEALRIVLTVVLSLFNG